MVESLFTWEDHPRALRASAKGKGRDEPRIYGSFEYRYLRYNDIHIKKLGSDRESFQQTINNS